MRLSELTKGQAYDKYGGRQGARKAQQSNQDKVTGLQKPQHYNLSDIVDVETRKDPKKYKAMKYSKDYAQHKSHLDHLEGRDLVTIKFTQPKILKQSGIYVWRHADYGIFYIGIAAANNLKQRWDSHIQKILGRVHSSMVPRKWAAWGKEIIDNAGDRGGITVDEEIAEDVGKVKVSIYPVIRPEALSDRDFKKELEKIEHRIVSRMNPRLNAVSKTKGSVTRDPYGTNQ